MGVGGGTIGIARRNVALGRVTLVVWRLYWGWEGGGRPRSAPLEARSPADVAPTGKVSAGPHSPRLRGRKHASEFAP